jgi:hypothetical protein
MTSVTSIAAPNLDLVLPDLDFADAFQIVVPQRANAEVFTQYMMTNPPSWVARLLALRNFIMKPFGLKTHVNHVPESQLRYGMFPVISATPDRTILGFDDHHLDFRIVIDAAPQGLSETRLVMSTAVRTHNLLGRAYLAIVLPFHRLIVPVTLRTATKLGR